MIWLVNLTSNSDDKFGEQHFIEHETIKISGASKRFDYEL